MNDRPLYIFSLKTLCREGARLVGRELELDDELVPPVAMTMSGLGVAGAEVWLVTERAVSEGSRTADWLTRHGLTPDALHMGCSWSAGDSGLDVADVSRCVGVFEAPGCEDRWPGLPVFTVGEVVSASRIIV